MLDVMIDLETLGVTSRSAIVTIGACKFSAGTGKVDRNDTFYRRIRWESATHRRHVDPNTLRWWMEQNAESFKEVLNITGQVSLKEALTDLAEWVDPNCSPWGNGASFDIAMIEDAMHQYGIDIPWKFWNVLDMRTMVFIGKRLDMDPRKIKREGTHHNALDDALHQAEVVGKMYAAILRRASK